MDGLRWLLLLFGLVVIAGVYLYSRRATRQSEDAAAAGQRREPQLDVDDVAALDSPNFEHGERMPDDGLGNAGAVPSNPTIADGQPTPELPDNVPQKIVTLRVVGRNKHLFAGDELILSMRGIGLRHGKFGIFHRYDGNDESRTVFSAASLVEPGSFDLQNIKEQQIPGISLFLVLPGPVDGVDAFDQMIAAARAIAQSLNGELLDETGSTLSIQRERYLREEIIQYQHSILVA